MLPQFYVSSYYVNLLIFYLDTDKRVSQFWIASKSRVKHLILMHNQIEC